MTLEDMGKFEVFGAHDENNVVNSTFAERENGLVSTDSFPNQAPAEKTNSYRYVSGFYDFTKNPPIVTLIKQVNKKQYTEILECTIKPYFYTKEPFIHPLIVSTEELTINNETLYKHSVNKPFDVKTIRDELEADMTNKKPIETFESDIPFVKRFVIDQNINIGEEPLFKCYFDIETNNPSTRFPNPEIDQVSTISVIGEDNEEQTWHIRDFNNNERLLLTAFIKHINKYSLLCGWNAIGFDIPFLQERIARLKIPFIFAHYFQVCDTMKEYKRFITSYNAEPVESFALEQIAMREFPGNDDIAPQWWVEHKNIDITNISRDEMVKYCRQDVVAVKSIDEKMMISNLIDAQSVAGTCFFEDTSSFSRIIDFMLLRFSRDENNKPFYIHHNKQYGLKSEKYSGAYVHNPVVGKHENVVTLDFTSLYPSLIKTFNISFDTLVQNGGDNAVNTSTKTTNTIKIPGLNVNFIKQTGDGNKVGVYPKMIDYILELRKTIKDKMKQYPIHSEEWRKYNMQQIGVKFLAASFYGVLGFEGSRIYNADIAESITTAGRYFIKICVDYLTKNNFQVVYGDTDSVLYKSKAADNIGEIIIEANKILIDINNIIREEALKLNVPEDFNFLELKFERVYKLLYLIPKQGADRGTKKRYFGKVIYEDDKPCNYNKIVGLEAKRGDWCILAKNIQKAIIKKLLDEENPKDVYNFVLSEIQKMKHGEYDNDLVIYKSLTRPIEEYKVIPIHAKISNASDFVGQKIGYIITNYHKNKIISAHRKDEVLSEHKAKPHYAYYEQKQIMKPTMRILFSLLPQNRQHKIADFNHISKDGDLTIKMTGLNSHMVK